MILAASSQSSLWAHTTTSYSGYLLPNPAVGVPGGLGNFGFWSAPTTAPNGLIYMLPVIANSQDGGVTASSWVAVGKPNNSAKKTDWYVISGNGSTRATIPNTTSVRYGPKGILAPNGLLYFLPDKAGDTGLIIMNPGSGLEIAGAVGNVSGTTLTITSVTSGVFGINQTITYTDPISSSTVTRTITNFGTGTGAAGTYTLDSAVPNPAVGITISGSEFPNCTWEYKSYASIRTATGNVGIANTFQTAAVLGPDGYIYLLPSANILLRIAPRNTAVNSTSSDIYEVHGYYDGTTVARRFYSTGSGGTATMYFTPKDINGVALSKTPPYPTANITNGSWVYGIDCGILHPNGKIYMAGSSRWIFILDPAKWDLADASIVYSDNNLALRTDICLTNISVKELVLEKPISNTLVKIKEIPNYLGGNTVTVKITDTSQVYDGMTATVYSGTGVFAAGIVTVLSKNATTSEVTLQNTSVTDILTTNFDLNDLVMLTPTQAMIESVNILWLTDINSTTNGAVSNQRKFYKINPITNTISAFGDAMGTGGPGTALSFNSISATFPNGLIYKPAYVSSSLQNSTIYYFSGSDNYPSKSFQYVRNAALSPQLLTGISTASPFTGTMASATKIGGTVTGVGNALGKIIFSSISAGGIGGADAYLGGEIISIKGYSPFTKYFNYTNDDRLIYEIPSDLADLPTSLYNCYFNKTS